MTSVSIRSLPWPKVIKVSLLAGFILQALVSLIPFTYREVGINYQTGEQETLVDTKTSFHIGYPAYAYVYSRFGDCSQTGRSSRNFRVNLLLWNGLALAGTIIFFKHTLSIRSQESSVKTTFKKTKSIILGCLTYGIIIFAYWQVINFTFASVGCGEI